MKRVEEAVLVETKEDLPERLQWRNRTYSVNQIRESWILQGRWWGKEEKRFYYVVYAGEALFRIYRSEASWFVSKVYD